MPCRGHEFSYFLILVCFCPFGINVWRSLVSSFQYLHHIRDMYPLPAGYTLAAFIVIIISAWLVQRVLILVCI